MIANYLKLFCFLPFAFCNILIKNTQIPIFCTNSILQIFKLKTNRPKKYKKVTFFCSFNERGKQPQEFLILSTCECLMQSTNNSFAWHPLTASFIPRKDSVTWISLNILILNSRFSTGRIRSSKSSYVHNWLLFKFPLWGVLLSYYKTECHWTAWNCMQGISKLT